jgi:hypothetical protein
MQDRGFYTVEQVADTLDLTPGTHREPARAMTGAALSEKGQRYAAPQTRSPRGICCFGNTVSENGRILLLVFVR